MKEIDIEKRESVNKDLLNMIDNMVSKKKPITQHCDISTILVDHNADPKIIDTDVREVTPKSPTLPKPKMNIIKKIRKVAQNDEKVHSNTKINNKPSFGIKKTETEGNYNKTHAETNVSKKLKLIDMFDENVNNNKSVKKQLIKNEEFDLDVLDYSEMNIESTIHDDTFEKRTNNQQINENHENIYSDSVENTSHSSRKIVTSTSNDICVPNNDNCTPNNDNCSPDNDNSPLNNVNIPPKNDKSSPNNVVDSTQSNGKPMDSDTFQYNIMIMKMFLAELSISFNSIYNFM